MNERYNPVPNPGKCQTGFFNDRFGNMVGSRASVTLSVVVGDKLMPHGWPRRRAAMKKLAARLRLEARAIDAWLEQYPVDHPTMVVDSQSLDALS